MQEKFVFFVFIKMATVLSSLASITKLKGRENYVDWKFSTEAYLEHEGLTERIEGTETDEAKIKKSQSKVGVTDGANQFWAHSKLSNGQGRVGQVEGNFRRLRPVSTHQFNSSVDIHKVGELQRYGRVRVTYYVNKIISAAHKLQNINHSNVSDAWIATFLLAGLTESYKPMIMAIENSGVEFTSDAIKTKLLQEIKPSDIPNTKALFTKGSHRRGKQRYNQPSPQTTTSAQTSNTSSNVRCYMCQQLGHISKFCPKKKKGAMSASCTSTSQSFFIGPNVSGFYGASCAVA